ncbi:hypothetical protein CBS101457_002923 [Exobasidium rhododendri]|nr:hypothetical protein CBS101457_002923 [Exobasidium rhododendri]
MAAAGRVDAACECGYLDPASGQLWTDATITYFNETGLADVVVDVQQSPSIYGQETNGQTGDGQQAWSLIGDHINDWEDSFGATYRSAVSFNNTFYVNESVGLGMQVSPATQSTHVVNGSQLVTRRRDIQYGSFRAFILPTASENLNGGSAFTFGVSYNDSETVDLTLYTSDHGQNNHSLSWSFSATGRNADPVSNLLDAAAPGADVQAGLEHRIDWTSNKRIGISNSGTNASANSITYVKGVNASFLPTTAAPVSFQTWSNGEPSASMGPPQVFPAITAVLYTRFFYNSTLAERNAEFNQQCQAADTITALCGTEDYTLRGSTLFNQSATDQFKPAPLHFSVPLYATIVESIVAGFLLLLVLHVLVIRRFSTKTLLPKADIGKIEDSHSTPTDSVIDSVGPAAAATTSSSTVHIAETVLLARRSSLTSSGHGHGHGHKRSGSSVGHGSSLGHTTLNGGGGSRHSLPQYSSRPSSIIHGRSNRPPRDITDLDNMFDGWETDSGYDSDDFAQAERISGNYERYDDGEGDGDADRLHEVEILPLSHPKDVMAASRQNSSHSIRKSNEASQPQIVQWQVRDRGSTDAAEATQLAEPMDASDALEIARTNPQSALAHLPTMIVLFFRRLDQMLFISRTTQLTASGQRRIDYLDGMRGAACFLVSLGHFTLIFFIGIPNPGAANHYPGFEHWYRYIFGPIGTNASLLLGIFFALPARTMCQRYLQRGGLATLADTTVRRIPRLMLPVTAAALINYFMMDVNGFKWVQRLASRTWSVWSYWETYDNALVFFNAVVTLCWGGPPDQPALVTGYATGVLWTIPVIVQGMWTVMVATVIAHEIKSHWKRFAFYFLAVLFSWYAETWDSFFMTGLIVGDLDSMLRYREAATRGIPLPIPAIRRKSSSPDESRSRWCHIDGKYLSWLFLAACCTQQWISYIPSAPGNRFNFIEQSIHPDWQTEEPRAWIASVGFVGYTNPNITGFFLIMALFMAADLTLGIQKFFRLRVFHWLGIHSMSIYLLHGVVFWTWDAWLCLTMLKNGAPYWGAVLACFFTGYVLLFIVAICFTYTFEVWAVLFAKSIWRAASGNIGRRV